MSIIKFGGSSLHSLEKIKLAIEVIKQRLSEKQGKKNNQGLIIVLSAIGKTTKLLERSIIEAIKSDKKEINEIANKAICHYTDIIKEANLNTDCIKESFTKLKDLLSSINKKGEVDNKTIDLTLSIGEECSVILFSKLLEENNIESSYITPKNIGIITDNRFRNADVIESETKKQLKKDVKSYKSICIFPGFVGRTKENFVTTLGKDGSDYTATIIASALNESEVEIWTDVDGIMSADPKLIKSTKQIKNLSFETALEICSLGSKVVHAKAINLCLKKGINIKIFKLSRQAIEGKVKPTIISEKSSDLQEFLSIGYRKNISIIRICSSGMVFDPSFAKRVFTIFLKTKYHL